MNTTKKKSLLYLFMMFTATLLLALVPFVGVRASAETNALVFENGAYIRVDTNSDEANTTTGIRFAVEVDASIYDKDEIGMIIVPNSILENFDAQNTYTDYFEYFENVYGKSKAEVSTTVDSEALQSTNGMFYGVIARIKNANYNKEYGAVAYYLDGTTYHYTRCEFTRRIADVANTAIQTGDFSNQQNTVLSNIIKKAITLKNAGLETATVNLSVGKTIDLGQVVTDNYITANRNVITWSVTEGNDVVKLGFLDNIYALKAGTAKLTGSAYGGKVVINVDVTVTEPIAVQDVVDYVVDVPTGEDIRVLQLTDTQIADSTQDTENQFGNVEVGSKYLYKPEHMEENVFKYVRKAVSDANPHLIILTGDNVYGLFDNAGTSFTKLVEVMDSFGIPWAVVYGNHDNESTMGAWWQNEQLKKAEYCLFNQGVAEGNGNYSIGLKQDGEIKRVFYLMDSNYCGAGYDKANNNVEETKGFKTEQMDWFVGSVSKVRELDADLPISMAYHVPDVNFSNANEKYLNATLNGTKYYTIGANVVGYNGDFGSNASETGEVEAVETFDVEYDGKTLLEIYKEYGIDSVFVGHKHSHSMSILHEGIRWTFGLKTGVYDHISVDMMGGTLATIDGTGAIQVKHLYYDDAYAAQMQALQDPAVNGLVSVQGLPLIGDDGEIVRTNSIQKTYPVSVEYVKDSAGESSVAYRFQSHTIYVADTHLKVDLTKFEGATSIKFKFLVKEGEFTKEMGGTRSEEIIDGRYVVSGAGSNSVMALSIGNIGTYWLNEKDVDNYGSKKVYYTAGEWAEIEAPLVDGDKVATSFGFMVSTASTIYLKDIQVVDFTLAEEGQTLAHYVGDTRQLTVSGTGLTYSSSDDAVVSVSQTGEIECKTIGSAVITVKGKYGYERKVSVTVDEVPADVAYTVNYYMQNANGTYTIDENATVQSMGRPGTSITAETPEKEGFTVNTEKSTITDYIQADGTLTLKVYYDIAGVTFNKFVVSEGTVGAFNSTGYTENSDGSVSYVGVEKTMATITHSNCEYIFMNRVADMNYLFVTLKYNEGTDTAKNWGVTVSFGSGSNRALTVEYNDVYTLNASGKFVPYADSTIAIDTVVTYIIDLDKAVTNIDNADIADVYTDSFATWKIRFNYDKAVNLDLYNYAFLTTEQADKYFDKANYVIKHYEISSKNDLVEIADSAQTLSGFVGTTATATALSGYTLNETYSTQSGEILADGSLVLEMIYGTLNGMLFNRTTTASTNYLYSSTPYGVWIDGVIKDDKIAQYIYDREETAYDPVYEISADALVGAVSVTFSYYVPNDSAIGNSGNGPFFIKTSNDTSSTYRWLFRHPSQKVGDAYTGDWADSRSGAEWHEYEFDTWQECTITLPTESAIFKITLFQASPIYISNITINKAN